MELMELEEAGQGRLQTVGWGSAAAQFSICLGERSYVASQFLHSNGFERKSGDLGP